MLKRANEGPGASLRDPTSGTFRHGDRERSSLAYALHDARNLLSVIVANVGWLGENTPSSLDEVVRDVAVAAERLQGLLEATLARSDRASVGSALELQLARVSEILRDATHGFRHPPRGIRVDVSSSGEDVVEVDAPLVTRVVANLLSNAIRHSPDGEVVTIHAEVSGGRLTLTATDFGEGVSPDRRESIFHPGGPGSIHGLGLAFCRRVALEHGGTIELQPSARGAQFVFVVPIEAGDP